jgi:hypothetical protein
MSMKKKAEWILQLVAAVTAAILSVIGMQSF